MIGITSQALHVLVIPDFDHLSASPVITLLGQTHLNYPD